MDWLGNLPIFVICLSWGILGSLGHPEADCIEVGFARAAGSALSQGFDIAQGSLRARWAVEDQAGYPSFAGLSEQIKNVSRAGQLLEEASKQIVGLIRKTRVGKRCLGDWLLKGVEKHVTPLMNLNKDLGEELGLVMSFRCMVNSPYANVDGTCINQESPDLGAIGSKFLRLQPASSGRDGFSLRESASSDKTLPSARTVSEAIRKNLKKPEVTGAFTHWGHHLQMDMFNIPDSPGSESVDCCGEANSEQEEFYRGDCAPIYVEKDDPMAETNKCINYKRSLPAQAILGHRESLTTVSTYLDMTPVYGATNEVAFSKKVGYFGYIKAPSEPGDEGGPVKVEPEEKCGMPDNFEGCFPEAEEPEDGAKFIPGLPMLLSMEHNRIADVLAEQNPNFDDSLLYNEARRITIAEYNYITYGEYLPTLMGQPTVEKHHLKPGSEGQQAQYVKEVNPGVLTSYALGAFRNPSMYTQWLASKGSTDLFDSSHYQPVRNMYIQDFLAIDIQKGRDHGVPGYLTWLRFCDPGKHYHTFEDLAAVMSKENAEMLKELYQNEIDDVDIMAALLENVEPGTAVGPTFICLMADQFARLRTGNRLYWEHETSLFTEEQKNLIKAHTSLAHLLCNNLKGLHAVPRNSFLPESDSNPLVECSSLETPNYEVWKNAELDDKMKELQKEGKLNVLRQPKPEKGVGDAVEEKPAKEEQEQVPAGEQAPEGETEIIAEPDAGESEAIENAGGTAPLPPLRGGIKDRGGEKGEQVEKVEQVIVEEIVTVYVPEGEGGGDENDKQPAEGSGKKDEL